jgi:SHS2 domain-containing protein
VTNSADFVEVEHTADWAIRVRGKTLSELFINVAIGMYGLLVDLPSEKAEIERTVDVEGVHRAGIARKVARLEPLTVIKG